MNALGKSLPPLATLLPFEAAARLESFSRAADELHLTQAAVSRQIRGLEENLGVKLFQRRNRAVFLTEEGRALGQVVSAALQRIGDSAVSLRERPGKNRVVLLCQLCEAFYWLMPRLSMFHQRHPEIEIQLLTSTRSLLEFEDSFDVALQSAGRPSGLHVLAFTAADEVFPVCSAQYLANRAPLNIKQPEGHVFLHHRETPAHLIGWEQWLEQVGCASGAQVRGISFDSYPLLLQAAVEGHGIALGWRRTAERLIDTGALVRPCAEHIALPDAIAVYRQQGASERAEVQVLLAWLAEQLCEPDPA